MRLHAPGLLVVGLVACGKGPSATTVAVSPSAMSQRDGAPSPDAPPAVAPDPVIDDLWARATDGDEDDLARLSGALGSDALIEAAAGGLRRRAAVRGLAYAGDFTPLPFLASVAALGNDEDAALALGSAAFLASGPRRATDPEDALELHEGASRLLALAKDLTRPVPRRAGAVRVLRLLVDRGAVGAADVPTDVDAH